MTQRTTTLGKSLDHRVAHRNSLRKGLVVALPYGVEGQTRRKRTSLRTMNLCTSLSWLMTTSDWTGVSKKCRRSWTARRIRSWRSCSTVTTSRYKASLTKTTARIASRKDTELGLVPSPTNHYPTSSVPFATRQVTQLLTVLRSKPTSKNNRLNRLQSFWSHSTHSSRKTSRKKHREGLLLSRTTQRRTCLPLVMGKHPFLQSQTLKASQRRQSLPRWPRQRCSKMRLSLMMTFRSLKMTDFIIKT